MGEMEGHGEINTKGPYLSLLMQMYGRLFQSHGRSAS